jgi:hypothetical protein
LLIVRYRSTPAVAMTDTDISSKTAGKSCPPADSDVGGSPLNAEAALKAIQPTAVAPNSANSESADKLAKPVPSAETIVPKAS